MKAALKFIVILSTIVLPLHGYSQSGVHQCYGFDCRQKKWSVSVFTGLGMMGPGKNLEQALSESRFENENVTSESGFVPGEYNSINHYQNHPVWKLALTHQVTKKSFLTFNVGESWSQTASGKQQVGWNLTEGNALNNRLQLKSIGHTVSLQYEIHPWQKNRNGFAIGPAVVMHQVKQCNAAKDPFHQFSVLPGIDFGGQVSIVNAKSWFVLFKAGYQWFPGDHVSAVTINDHNSIVGPTAINSVFKGADVNLQTVNAGITIGFKF